LAERHILQHLRCNDCEASPYSWRHLGIAVGELSAERMSQWTEAHVPQLDLLAIHTNGMHITNELTLLAAIAIDGEGAKNPLGLCRDCRGSTWLMPVASSVALRTNAKPTTSTPYPPGPEVALRERYRSKGV
jgi:hypothetical protein